MFEGVLVKPAETVADKIHAVMNHPLAQIKERVLSEGSIGQELIDTAILEYRKFMALFASGCRNLAMCSKEVDEIWHTHILFTRDYMKFCRKGIGDYVHHVPNTTDMPTGADSVENFYSAYQNAYGSIPAIWRGQNTLCYEGCDGKPQCCASCSDDDGDDRM